MACRAEEISARTGATILLQLLFYMATPGAQVDRLLDGPTNEVWIDPWLEYLGKRGVRYFHRVEVQHIDCRGDRITGVTIRNIRHWIRRDRHVPTTMLPPCRSRRCARW